jgi:hypothetical protein
LICTIFAFIFTLSISIIAIILGIVIILAICAIVLFLINGIINLFGFENIGDPKKLTQNIRLILSNFEENLDGCEKETDLPIENIVAADAEDGDEDESEDEDIYTVKTKEEMISLLMGALLQLSLGLAAATAIPAVIWDLWFIH